MITTYKAKALTYHRDTLPALSGITNRIRGLGKYYGGMWASSLANDLLWFSIIRDSPQGQIFPKRPESGTLSFLWASTEGAIAFVDIEISSSSPQKKYLSTMKAIECVPKGLDPLGELSGGIMQLWARAIPAKFVNIFEKPMPASIFIKDKCTLPSDPLCLWATLHCPGIGHYVFHPDSMDLEMGELLCIPIFSDAHAESQSCYGMVLQKLGRVTTRGLWLGRRVGIIATIEFQHFDAADMVEVWIE
ncbi:hypothetical protein NA57DRAFT_79393 [Rhizodiscina lignyota]|uniref:Uncharacterized protein n=1 Tax=Rhizodiscina lignyota TaxID=1504668 RepID=A0A9P4M3G3_9PEZI|nr:hypothetical protein NA57DRAFT_79393 [Rhizodiscina lignyota]